MEVVKLLIADDHKLIRNGVKLMLANQSTYKFIFTEVSSGEDLIDLLKDESFDFIILDISLPNMSGIEVLKYLKTNQISTPVLVQTMHKEIDIIRQSLEYDANGYILKSSEKDELINAIITIFEGNRYLSQEVSMIFADEVSKNLSIKANTDLSVRQIEILKSLAKGKTNDELAAIYNLSKRTIEGHRSRILKKLNLKTTSDLVRYVFENKL